MKTIDSTGWSHVGLQPGLKALFLVEERTALAYDLGVLSRRPDFDYVKNCAGRLKLSDFSIDDRDPGWPAADNAPSLSLEIVSDGIEQNVRATAYVLVFSRLDLVGCR